MSIRRHGLAFLKGHSVKALHGVVGCVVFVLFYSDFHDSIVIIVDSRFPDFRPQFLGSFHKEGEVVGRVLGAAGMGGVLKRSMN